MDITSSNHDDGSTSIVTGTGQFIRPLSLEAVSTCLLILHESVDRAAELVAEHLRLPDYKTDARSAVKVDYMMYALAFARETGYGPQCTKSLLDIALNLLLAMEGDTAFSNLEATFKKQMLEQTRANPGVDTGNFSADQVACIARFFTRTFFKHWRLYKYCLQQTQEVDQRSDSVMIETAVVPSFDGVMTHEEWTTWKAAAEAAAQQAAAAAATAHTEQDVSNTNGLKDQASLHTMEEQERQRKEDLARKPATLEEAVNHIVALRLDEERKSLAAEYQSKEDILLKKISDLESRPAASAKK